MNTVCYIQRMLEVVVLNILVSLYITATINEDSYLGLGTTEAENQGRVPFLDLFVWENPSEPHLFCPVV